MYLSMYVYYSIACVYKSKQLGTITIIFRTGRENISIILVA